MKILGVLAYLISALLSCAALYFTFSDIPVAGVHIALGLLIDIVLILTGCRILEGLNGKTHFTKYYEEY